MRSAYLTKGETAVRDPFGERKTCWVPQQMEALSLWPWGRDPKEGRPQKKNKKG